MSDEKLVNQPPEKPTVVNPPQEASQHNNPTKQTNESKKVELNESFAGKTEAGDQGISLKPIGSHNSDPFVSQDIIQAQPLPTPITPTPVQSPVTSTTTQSDSNSVAITED